jgi:DNA-binding NtrC family response regulator
VTYREAMDTANREYLTRVLAEARGKVEAAAILAGVHRATMYKLIARYGVIVTLPPQSKTALPSVGRGNVTHRCL